MCTLGSVLLCNVYTASPLGHLLSSLAHFGTVEMDQTFRALFFSYSSEFGSHHPHWVTHTCQSLQFRAFEDLVWPPQGPLHPYTAQHKIKQNKLFSYYWDLKLCIFLYQIPFVGSLSHSVVLLFIFSAASFTNQKYLIWMRSDFSNVSFMNYNLDIKSEKLSSNLGSSRFSSRILMILLYI